MTESEKVGRAIIAEEYTKLCAKLGMEAVELDVYVWAPDAGPGDLSSAGTALSCANAMYHKPQRLVILPLGSSLDWPSAPPPHPPPTLCAVADGCWPVWRIDLWHEVVHQFGDQVLSEWAPLEPGCRKANGRMGNVGHGIAWNRAVDKVATLLNLDAGALDRLLD